MVDEEGQGKWRMRESKIEDEEEREVWCEQGGEGRGVACR